MRVSAVVVAIAVAAALFLGWRLFSHQPADDMPPQGTVASAVHSDVSPSINTAGPGANQSIDPRLVQIADALRSKHAAHIHKADRQIQLLNHLMSLLQEMYPQGWREAMLTVLQLAFPEWADRLMARLQDWLDYQRWLEDVFSSMTFTDAEQRYQTLWDKRLALFGDDARVIWAAELRQRAFAAAVQTLDQQPGDVTSKAERYVELIRETWGDTAFGNHGRNTTQLMGDFVKLESVQAQLRQMDPGQQQTVLNQFRRDMGLDEEAIDRWESLDEERREHRAIGETYMSSRAAILEQMDGQAAEQAIHALQIELFGEEEARYLRNEEASGVFRFESEQVVGFN